MATVSRQRLAFGSIGAVILAGVFCLYQFAPCTTFVGWSPPRFFYGIVWPALIPATVAMYFLSVSLRADSNAKKWVFLGWMILAAVVGFGWYDGYFETYIWWKSTAGAPWPEYC